MHRMILIVAGSTCRKCCGPIHSCMTTGPYNLTRGWLGVAKVSDILGYWGIQMILASSWTRPAILIAGKGRGGMFLLLQVLHFHSCSAVFIDPLYYLLYYPFYPFPPFLLETTHNDPQGLTCR